jgi:type I restriction enzyme M protein
MLDTETKRRIDTARDILVGKVPDPKSQVEQITIALIYKFMDDMDAESEEFGGKRKFFAGDYVRYGWAKLMHSGLGGYEILNLYAESITKMPENPGIPPLFRNIFKNAYLPYRDPETLRAFLKTIDEFEYDHSERLGDAFEYLLSVLGSQGDAGQFRTPRHIIDFMVEVIDPKKNETILDPACGTAGFLISSYKHILRVNTDAEGNSTLTPDDKGRLAKNFKGYDISPDMVRLSLVNLYLHGFTDPHIYEYDTLTSEDKWNEYADVILANPPFMSPKGGIKPHKRFSVTSKRSEVLFVDYMAEHLTPSGRAGIIVPEGIIFQSQNAYKQLRKMLVEEFLVAVVSLPAGVFNPYSGVKTSILILDKSLAKQSDTIAFFKVENDGFGLGAQRRKIEKNDLPQVTAEIADYLGSLRARESIEELKPTLGLIVPKEKIAANGEYNLSGERYRESDAVLTAYELVPVRRFMKPKVKSIDPRTSPENEFELWSIPAYDARKPELLQGGDIGSQKKCVFPGDVLLSRIIPHICRAWVVSKNEEGRRQVGSTEWIVFSSEEVLPQFLRHVLISDPFHARFMQTITGVGGSLSLANPSAVGDIQIPLPPLEVQKEIVAEIEGYQKVIDGARAVIDNYKPHILIHPDWPMVELRNILKLSSGRGLTKAQMEDGPYPVYGGNGKSGLHSQYFVEEPIIVIGRVGAYCGAVHITEPKAWVTDNGLYVTEYKQKIEQRFLAQVLAQLDLNQFAKVGGQPSISQTTVYERRIPLPPLATQQVIVAEIEVEQKLVNANRELIERMEKKIQAVLARVWEEEA